MLQSTNNYERRVDLRVPEIVRMAWFNRTSNFSTSWLFNLTGPQHSAADMTRDIVAVLRLSVLAPDVVPFIWLVTFILPQTFSAKVSIWGRWRELRFSLWWVLFDFLWFMIHFYLDWLYVSKLQNHYSRVKHLCLVKHNIFCMTFVTKI